MNLGKEVVMAKRKSKKSNNRAGKICILTIMCMFLAVMSIQIFRLYQEDQDCIQKQNSLKAQIEEATEQQQKLASDEERTQSQEYIEEIAKSKLGLAYPNEIIFKEKDK